MSFIGVLILIGVTPQNFDLVLLIKILPKKLNFCFLGLSFDFRTPLLFDIVGFYLKWRLSKSIIGPVALSIKQLFISGFICIIVYPELYSFKMIFHKFGASVALQPFD